jgi:hypothetical protein
MEEHFCLHAQRIAGDLTEEARAGDLQPQEDGKVRHTLVAHRGDFYEVAVLQHREHGEDPMVGEVDVIQGLPRFIDDAAQGETDQLHVRCQQVVNRRLQRAQDAVGDVFVRS